MMLLAECMSTPLGLTAAASAADAWIHKKYQGVNLLHQEKQY